MTVLCRYRTTRSKRGAARPFPVTVLWKVDRRDDHMVRMVATRCPVQIDEHADSRTGAREEQHRHRDL
jgi:hypothetical protein